MDHPLPVRLGAEALGTFLFFFLGFSGIAAFNDVGVDQISPLGIAFGFGLGLALAITAFGHISGGHFNPAVSAGLAVAVMPGSTTRSMSARTASHDSGSVGGCSGSIARTSPGRMSGTIR